MTVDVTDEWCIKFPQLTRNLDLLATFVKDTQLKALGTLPQSGKSARKRCSEVNSAATTTKDLEAADLGPVLAHRGSRDQSRQLKALSEGGKITLLPIFHPPTRRLLVSHELMDRPERPPNHSHNWENEAGSLPSS